MPSRPRPHLSSSSSPAPPSPTTDDGDRDDDDRDDDDRDDGDRDDGDISMTDYMYVCMSCLILTFLSGVFVCLSITFYQHEV